MEEWRVERREKVREKARQMNREREREGGGRKGGVSLSPTPVLQCLQRSVKKCRCGKKDKEVPCSSEYLCDLKCTLMRQCGRHQCRRKVSI